MPQIYETTLMLTDTMQVLVEIEYHITATIPGDYYYEQPCGGELEIEGVSVLGVQGETYAKDANELFEQGWLDDIVAEVDYRMSQELYWGLDDQLYEAWDEEPNHGW